MATMEKLLRETLVCGKFAEVAETDSKRMRAVRGRGNRTTELVFRLTLVRAGIKGWKLNPDAVPGKPDFYFPAEGVAVFTDGCFWHGCPRCGHVPMVNRAFWAAKIARNRRRDEQKTADLAAIGVRSLRFWEHELQESPAGCLARVKEMLFEGQQSGSPAKSRRPAAPSQHSRNAEQETGRKPL